MDGFLIALLIIGVLDAITCMILCAIDENKEDDDERSADD